MIHYLYLGRMGYAEALALQNELAELRYQSRIGNVLLLLEHPPVLTLGRNADRTNIIASDELLAARGVEVFPIKRGGDVTYHGPGQLVGYPIFDLRTLQNSATCHAGLRMGPVDFVRQLEEILIRLTGHFGIHAGRIAGLTGVWCGLGDTPESCQTKPSALGRKIAAIGIHVSRGITTHGFAYNLNTNLSDFQLINPCGITDRPVTSLDNELALAAHPDPLPSLETLANNVVRLFGQVLCKPVLAVEDMAALRALIQQEPAIIEVAE
jgi:lipoyl(octanoyl) transferase